MTPYYADEMAAVYQGDALDVLRELETESVNCIVTSPPYWGLRDYGVEGQLGLERTPDEYVGKLADIFREARRVLCKDGTLWLNLGDCYATTGAGKVGDHPGGGEQGKRWKGYRGDRTGHNGKHEYVETGMGPMTQPNRMPLPGLKPKDLVGIPWRVAFALQADGWYLRSDIIWSKPNPMPESVTDRPSRAHEYIFLMSKSERYYYDHEAVQEPASSPENKLKSHHDPMNPKYGSIPHDRYKDQFDGRVWGSVGKRNRRSVWQVPLKPCSEAHFAVYPGELIQPCILAGCPKGGTVLDPFHGAGTTMMEANRLGRQYVGIELKAEYIDLSIRRARGPLFTQDTSS